MNIGFVKAQSDNLPKVTVLMVTEFFSESECFDLVETSGVKARRAEREDYGDAAVGYVELRREGQCCAVRGRVCPEHRVNSKAYAVSIMVDEENESIKSVTCEDCAASAGGCKHAIAVLMWVHRRSEETEPTATVCFWKKARLAQVASNVRSLKAKDMRQSKVQTELPDNTTFFKTLLDEMKKRQFDRQISRYYIKTDSNKVLSLHNIMLEFFCCSDNTDVESFLRFASDTMTEDRCNLARNETQNQSESKLWNELRYGQITASRIYEIAHCRTKNGSLVEQVIESSKIRDTEPMERGRRLKKDVVKLIEELLKTNIQDCGLLLDSRFPIIGASPDGVGNDFVVEIKCPMTCKAKSRYITENNQVANKFMAQIQLQMFMKKVKKGFFCVATHDFETSQSIKLICVEYDEDLVLDLIEKAMGFRKENIYSLIFNAATG
ncbi:uncharacterized protein LOC124309448 [Neodiprion virginianus]|uniref:uncharacterized protein LOC124309448 n=1 Tax=Neodiprion virginianus TaxID=2961670 RepID=UPI001EE7332F|nr:uncharacterized protein LOC124309448 [Neodiprion virginianus]